MKRKQCGKCSNLKWAPEEGTEGMGLCMLYRLEIWQIDWCEQTTDVKTVDATFLSCPVCGDKDGSLMFYAELDAVGNQIYTCDDGCGCTITIHRHSKCSKRKGRKFLIDNIKSCLEEFKDKPKVQRKAPQINPSALEMAIRVIVDFEKTTVVGKHYELDGRDTLELVLDVYKKVMPDLYEGLSNSPTQSYRGVPKLGYLRKWREQFHQEVMNLGLTYNFTTEH